MNEQPVHPVFMFIYLGTEAHFGVGGWGGGERHIGEETETNKKQLV